MKKQMLLFVLASMTAGYLWADFHDWAETPPMGWNSWDCYGAAVNEAEFKANVDVLAERLKPFGYEYAVCDIRWTVQNEGLCGYNQENPVYTLDEWGRYLPAPSRFPSAAKGAGFKPLADYVHSKGLKFGIHIMRGVPKEAVAKKLPVKGAEGVTCDMITGAGTIGNANVTVEDSVEPGLVVEGTVDFGDSASFDFSSIHEKPNTGVIVLLTCTGFTGEAAIKNWNFPSQSIRLRTVDNNDGTVSVVAVIRNRAMRIFVR